ncbi:MAG: hypothetical protein V3U87_15375 [Methylococcaceae bacterium]
MTFNKSNMLLVNNKGALDYYEMYASGYYVNIDRNNGTFYWDHDDNRFIIKVDNTTVKKAKRIIKKELKTNFTFGFNTASLAVLDHLQDNNIKNNTWLNDKIRTVYEELLQNDLAFTLESFYEGVLVGGIFGIPIGGTITIDTMYGIPSPPEMKSASKALFCHAILEMYESGIHTIDVETPHHSNHPCFRLGETEISFMKFRTLLKEQENRGASLFYDHFNKVWGHN